MKKADHEAQEIEGNLLCITSVLSSQSTISGVLIQLLSNTPINTPSLEVQPLCRPEPTLPQAGSSTTMLVTHSSLWNTCSHLHYVAAQILDIKERGEKQAVLLRRKNNGWGLKSHWTGLGMTRKPRAGLRETSTTPTKLQLNIFSTETILPQMKVAMKTFSYKSIPSQTESVKAFW